MSKNQDQNDDETKSETDSNTCEDDCKYCNGTPQERAFEKEWKKYKYVSDKKIDQAREFLNYRDRYASGTDEEIIMYANEIREQELEKLITCDQRNEVYGKWRCDDCGLPCQSEYGETCNCGIYVQVTWCFGDFTEFKPYGDAWNY